LNTLLGNIGIALACLPFVLYLIFWKSIFKSRLNGLLGILMCNYLLWNIASFFFIQELKIFPWYRTMVYFSILEVILLLWIFSMKIPKGSFIRNMLAALLLSGLIHVGLSQIFKLIWQVVAMTTGSIMVIAMSIAYMISLYRTSQYAALHKDPMFIFASAVLLYSGINVFDSFYNYIIVEQFHQEYVYYINVFYVFGIAYYGVMNWMVWKITNS
jgi:hypothetical protein